MNFSKHLEKSCDLVIFALIFQKKIEKVWNIEKNLELSQIQKKSRQKMTESQLFSKFLDGQAYNGF